MTSRSADILRVLNAVQEMELARLAETAFQFQAVSVKLAALRERRTRHYQHAPTDTDLPLSTIVGADEIWFLWVDREIQGINAELARLAAKKEKQTLQARTALGRMRAMKNVIEKHQMQQPRRDPNAI